MLTGVEEVQGIIEDIPLIHLRVSTVDDKGVPDYETGVANARAGTFRRRRQWQTRKIPTASLDEPKISLHG